MRSRGGALPEQAHTDQGERHQCCRGEIAAQRQTAIAQRLVQKVPHHRAQRTCQDERGPEQQRVRPAGSAVQSPKAVPRVCENMIVVQ